MTTDTTPETALRPTRVRRSAGLVGNRLALAGAVLYLCEFVGIIGTHVHPMPLLPGASAADVHATYAGQAGVAGFLVGWYALVLPGRILFALGLRRALDRAGRAGILVDWAVLLVAIGVTAEVLGSTLLAGAAAAVDRGDLVTARALDGSAHFLLPVVYCTSGVGLVVLALAMWGSGVFPRVLAGLGLVVATIMAVNGALLSAPGAAALQDRLSTANLLLFVFVLWAGVLLFRRAPRDRT